jgi:hypothetical protein
MSLRMTVQQENRRSIATDRGANARAARLDVAQREAGQQAIRHRRGHALNPSVARATFAFATRRATLAPGYSLRSSKMKKPKKLSTKIRSNRRKAKLKAKRRRQRFRATGL